MRLACAKSAAVALVGLVAVVACKPRTDDSSTLDAAGPDDIVSWVDNRAVTDWNAELKKRDKAIYEYLRLNDAGAAKRYGFSNNHTPQIAWKWFEDSPIGFGGIPFVLWKTISMLEDNDRYYTNMAQRAKSVASGSSYYTGITSYFGAPTPNFSSEEIAALRGIARLWHQPSPVNGVRNFDHIGLLPNPGNYDKAGDAYAPTYDAVKDPGIQKEALPYGMAYESAPGSFPTASKASLLKELSGKVSGFAQVKTKLAFNKFVWEKLGYNETEDDKPNTFGRPSKYDNVFFSCSACHVGRVITDEGHVRYMYGAPNTEIEAQYYSQILRDTAALLVEKGFDPTAKTFQGANEIAPNKTAVVALAKVMIMSVMVSPERFYGAGEENERRTYHQAMQLVDNFGGVIKELIGTGIKTHYIYNVIAGKNYYGDGKPDLLANRIGQMDAFGIASGLLAIHSFRDSFKSGGKTTAPSFTDFMYIVNPESPFFTGFDDLGESETLDGMRSSDVSASGKDAKLAKVQKQIRQSAANWAPKGPAPIDIKNLNFTRDRTLANWDGNQGAAARTLASGTSATGDPRKVNVRIHEPLNPLIDNLPPPPYPFKVDIAKAKEGKKIFQGTCAGCHKPNNEQIYPASSLGVDKWRSMTNTAVSRHGMAAVVLEACFYYLRNNPQDVAGSPGKPGTDRDWCLPKTLQGKWGDNLADFDRIRSMTKEEYKDLMDDYFKDTPKRVQDGENGYKADMLHGVWSNAPYLHNGSVPTLAHLMCDNIRPKKFVRGNINYDQDLVGFVWWQKPERYNRYDMTNFKVYDTTKTGWSNEGHTFGRKHCGEVGELGADASQEEIAAAMRRSPELSSLLEYLKTL